MLGGEPDRAWSGKHFLTILVKEDGATWCSLWLKSHEGKGSTNTAFP
jgi:hypothetical protein